MGIGSLILCHFWSRWSYLLSLEGFRCCVCREDFFPCPARYNTVNSYLLGLVTEGLLGIGWILIAALDRWASHS